MKLNVLSMLVVAGLAFPALAFQASQPPSENDAIKKEIANQGMAERVANSGKPPEPTFTDAEIKSLATLMSGQWKTTSPVDSDGGGKVELVMGVAPVAVQGLSNTLYCEVARADQLRVPIRQTILSFTRVGGKIRMTTFEYRRPGGAFPPAYTMWAAPSAFPWQAGPDDLVATLAFDFTGAGDRFVGKTPHAYPTGIGGAVEMTSEINVSKDGIQVADRGLDAGGKQTWGPAPGQFTTFVHADLPIKVVQGDEGLVSITYPSTLQGEPAKKDEQVTINYVAYLEDGRVVDSSYEKQRPLTFPQGTKLLEGWNRQMDDVQKGMLRRLVIPPKFAYGEQGRRRDRIPPNATMIYDVEVTDVQPAPATKTEPAPPSPAKEVPQMKDAPGDDGHGH